MKRMLPFVLFVSLLMSTSWAWAQGLTVTGKVIDAQTEEPLVGATVVIQGTTQGTITGLDGRFTLKNVADGKTVVVTFTGYTGTQMEVSGSGTVDLGTIKLRQDAVGLNDVEVIASIAKDRRTPVAASSIDGETIAAIAGNQEYPEVMRKMPGVYVTKQGGGFGDSRINIRGFDQRNTAVMINGIPVNDMENGWVYWSNWAGLADVTSQIQVQRGLGASKLAVSSVGGSINIITNGAELEQGGKVGVTFGNDGFQKYSASYNTGLTDKGWAFSILASHTRGDGYVQGTMFRAYNYFASLTKVFNDKHTVSLTALGAPQWHHQRFEPGRFDGVTLRTFVDPDDPNNQDPTTGRGIRYNWLFGELDGEEFSWRKNFYHKPKVFLNHYWTINKNTELKTSVYFSLGNGGGTGPRGRIKTDDGSSIFDSDFRLRDENGHVRFDDIVAYNSGQADISIFDPEESGTKSPHPEYGYYAQSDSLGFIRRASMNYHTWYGILSTLTSQLSDNLNFVGGVDARYYKGEHFRRLENLLGNDAYLSRSDINNPMNWITETSPADFGNFRDDSYINGNNVLNYHNDGLVSWLGLFAQLEYVTDKLSVFGSVSGSNQGFKRIDYFIYEENDPARESDWQNFLGGAFKAGANYNIDEHHNAFINAGYYSRQPIFDNVFINFRNDVNEDVKNQTVTAFEAGYGYRSKYFNAKANVYYTLWGNRQFDQSVQNSQAQEILYQFENVAQEHTGIEFELTAYPVKGLDVYGMLSIGNWVYASNFTATGTNLDTQQPEGELTIYADGLKVGDAAQTTLAVGAGYEFIRGLRVFADFYMADNLYANYDIQDSDFLQPGGEVVELPSYSLVDAGLSYRFTVESLEFQLLFNVNNLLDEQYISEMNTNIQDDPTTERNEFYDNRGVFGFGRTWNAGLRIGF